MSESYLGEIKLVAFGFVPRNWAACDGQTLSIAANNALFSLLGTTYGGNGVTTFCLPDLRGRVAVHAGLSDVGSQHILGEVFGSESVPLLSSHLPAHNHGLLAATAAANGDSPALAMLAPAHDSNMGLDVGLYAKDHAPNAALDPATLGAAGGTARLGVMQPYLVSNYIIAITGIYPSRS